MAEKVKNKKGKKRKVGRVFLVIGIILSMALGSMAAVAKYKTDGILSLVNQDKDNALNSVDISEYDTVSDSDVINAVGGVEATLTESEATNLNDTNYIRRKKYRNVKVGTQVLNGYQALGYCRIRHGKWKNGHYPAVLTASGKGDDYGRTERQRLVVQALLKKVKSLSIDKWMELIDVILPNVTTDLDKDSIYSYVLAVVKMGTTDIKQYHLPADGAYTSEKINGADCLVVDVEKNKKALSDFIYEK